MYRKMKRRNRNGLGGQHGESYMEKFIIMKQ